MLERTASFVFAALLSGALIVAGCGGGEETPAPEATAGKEAESATAGAEAAAQQAAAAAQQAAGAAAQQAAAAAQQAAGAAAGAAQQAAGAVAGAVPPAGGAPVGAIPPGAVPEGDLRGDATKGAGLYVMYCSSCHGPNGDGDGPVAATLNPKPAKHSDKAFMGSLTDEHLYYVIQKGGVAIGKSPLMAPWGPVVGDQGTRDLIGHLRKLSGT